MKGKFLFVQKKNQRLYRYEYYGCGIFSKRYRKWYRRRGTKRLFQPFEQGDIGYTKRYQGTGLGLAISKRLVEIMGGNIGFETEYGKVQDSFLIQE